MIHRCDMYICMLHFDWPFSQELIQTSATRNVPHVLSFGGKIGVSRFHLQRGSRMQLEAGHETLLLRIAFILTPFVPLQIHIFHFYGFARAKCGPIYAQNFTSTNSFHFQICFILIMRSSKKVITRPHNRGVRFVSETSELAFDEKLVYIGGRILDRDH